jgi:hypothetical protein
MTVSELYKQVAQLGFEDSLESDARFYYATNRALLQVSTIRPAIRSYSINHTPLANLLKGDMFAVQAHTPGIDDCFVVENAKAFYFEADGNGTARVQRWDEASGKWEDLLGAIPLSSARTFKAYSGLVKADGQDVNGLVRIRFSGEFFYSFRNVALYGSLYSDNEKDIPAYEPYVRYDMSQILDDFLAFDAAPVKEGAPYASMNQGYEIEGNTVLLPYDESGCYLVRYKHKPSTVQNRSDASADNTVLDMDEELCALLPCLIASYVLAEDEPSLAQYYLTLYREQIAIIDARTKKVAPVRIKRESGW